MAMRKFVAIHGEKHTKNKTHYNQLAESVSLFFWFKEFANAK